ncbi:MAG: M20/M25/M40 family metallo-hydrolase [Cyanobacteriota bacterium]
MLVYANKALSNNYRDTGINRTLKAMSAVSFAGQVTRNLEPQKVWSLFEEISKIYRESDKKEYGENNKEISDYLKNKLEKAGFKVEQKQENKMGKYNLLATRNMFPGKSEGIVLQAHMDMICVAEGPELRDKDPKKPIKLDIEGDILKANNRTLGADNGIGLAVALAVAEDSKFKHIPMQIIFTVNEETGMYGAIAVKPEEIKGKYFINLDSESYGKVIIGCAGMEDFEVENKPVKTEPIGSDQYKKLTFSIKGANGSHSATIYEGHLSPIREALKEVKKLSADTDIRLVSIVGGEKMNSMPMNTTVELLVPEKDARKVAANLKQDLEDINTTYKDKNKNMKTSVILGEDNLAANTRVIDSDFQDRLLQILGEDLLVGVRSRYKENNNLKTSQNLGILKLIDGEITLSVLMRSSDKAEKQDQKNKTQELLSDLFKEEIKPTTDPIWQPKYSSELTKLAVKAYKEVGVKEPVIETEHGGLENAQFAAKRPDVDQISVGPDIREPHSIQESIKISTVKGFYEFMEKLLEQINTKLFADKS